MIEEMLKWVLVPATFIGGVAFGWIAHVLRCRGKKVEQKVEQQIVKEPEVHEERVRFARLAPESMDQALSAAVYRAISEAQGELDLEIALPEKCVVFGREVSSKGTVRLGASGQLREEISRISRKIEEIDTKLRDFCAKNAPAEAAPTVSQGEDEDVPLF